ncbi:MAG: fibronectin type III domain-containing protein [Treponema sp.]|nr:fibronectin type III domain-containing protein [Treponema sp.]
MKHFVFSAKIASAILALALILSGCDLPENPGPETPGPETPNNDDLSSPVVTAAAISHTSIILSWPAISNADGYKIYWARYGYDSTYREIGTTTNTSYTDTGLSPDRDYYYRVSAFNGKKESLQSFYASARTLKAPPPIPDAAPTNLSATPETTGTSIRISWHSVTNATSDIVYRSLTDTGDYVEIGSVWSASYTDTGLSPETTYYYKVAAQNISGIGPLSDWVSATTLSAYPYVPNLSYPTGVGSSYILVEWASALNAEEYYVYRSSSSLGEYEKIGESLTTSYIDKNLSANTTYYYKVSGVNSYGESELSSSLSGKTLTMGAGLTREDAIKLSTFEKGYIPEETNEIWYMFTTSYGKRTLSANDRTDSIYSYTADIVVDVYERIGDEYHILYYMINGIIMTGKPFLDIDIGKGASDYNNITANNWGGTYYVRVKPKGGLTANKGTFRINFY